MSLYALYGSKILYGSKNQEMKRLIFIMIVLTFSTLLSAQGVFEWSEQQIITDTVSEYSNPFVTAYEGTAWMFYEKHGEFSSVHKMDLNNIVDSVLLLSAANVNYHNLYFAKSGGSFLGHLFYLSDEEGADNLYAAKLFENDSLGTAIKVIPNPGNLDIMDYTIGYDGYIGYTIDSNVYAAELKFYTDSVYTGNVELLDSSSFNAQVAFRTLVWQKMEDDSSHIFISNYEYVQDSGFFIWEEPYYLDSIGNCEYLTLSTTIDYMGGDEFCWVKGDTVVGHSEWWSDELNTISTFSRPNVRQISLVNWYVVVRYPYEEPHYLCFATGEGNSSEIFSSHGEMGGEDSAYVSNNNYPDDNPKVFYGEEAGNGQDYFVYCIWQSHLSSGTALSMAKSIAFIWGSVEENNIADNYLKVSPNPFHNNLLIDVNTYGKKAQLKILNIRGQQIKTVENLSLQPDWQTVSWQVSSNVPKGVYLIVLSTGGNKYVRKVLLQ